MYVVVVYFQLQGLSKYIVGRSRRPCSQARGICYQWNFLDWHSCRFQGIYYFILLERKKELPRQVFMEETLSLLNATTRIFFTTRLLIFLQKVLYDIEYSGVTAPTNIITTIPSTNDTSVSSCECAKLLFGSQEQSLNTKACER